MIANRAFYTVRMSKLKKQNIPVDAKQSGPVVTNKNGEIVIHILAKPGAKANKITDISEEGIGVQIASKPVDGEANSELLKYMTDILDVKKNEISLDKGSKSRQKTLLINRKECSVEYIMSKLLKETEK